VRSALEYVMLRTGIIILRLFPEKWVRSGMGRLFARVQFRRDVAIANLKMVFQEKDKAWREKLLKKMYYNYGLTAVETYITPSHKLFPKMKIEGYELIEKELEKGKGVLVASGHLGNFEMAGRWLAHDIPLGVVIKRQHNPYFDKYANDCRIKDKCTLIKVGNALRPILKLLKQNGLVMIMTDQNARSQGYQLDFMGSPASTHITLARIAIKYGIPIAIAGITRDENGYPLTVFRSPIDPTEYENSEDGYVKLMQKVLDEFGNMVKEYPEHWFWVHRRWRQAELGKVMSDE